MTDEKKREKKHIHIGDKTNFHPQHCLICGKEFMYDILTAKSNIDKEKKIRYNYPPAFKLVEEMKNRDKENKPSKKTEWDEIEEILEIIYDKALEGDEVVSDWKKRVLFFNGENLKNIIRSLLHQRDNEIREWASKRKKIKHWNQTETEWFLGYDEALDDLLTYLSNREV